MKKFLSLWIVFSVFALIIGFIVGSIESLYATPVDRGYGDTFCTVLGGCYGEPIYIVFIYGMFALWVMAVAFPVLMAIKGSFKVVFSKDKMK